MSLGVRPALLSDLDLVLRFIRALADYEKLSHEVEADETRLTAALFPKDRPPAAECLLAFREGLPAGFAVYYPNFSTFLALPGLYLEDLFVLPEQRRHRASPLISATTSTPAPPRC